MYSYSREQTESTEKGFFLSRRIIAGLILVLRVQIIACWFFPSDDSVITLENSRNEDMREIDKEYATRVAKRIFIPKCYLQYPVYHVMSENEKKKEKKQKKWEWKRSDEIKENGDFIEEIIDIMVQGLLWPYRPAYKLAIDQFDRRIREAIGYRQSQAAFLCIETYKKEKKRVTGGNRQFIRKLADAGVSIDDLYKIGIDSKFADTVRRGENISVSLEEQLCTTYHTISKDMRNIIYSMKRWSVVLGPSRYKQRLIPLVQSRLRLYMLWELLNLVRISENREESRKSRIGRNPYGEISRFYRKLMRVNEILNEIWHNHQYKHPENLTHAYIPLGPSYASMHTTNSCAIS